MNFLRAGHVHGKSSQFHSKGILCYGMISGKHLQFIIIFLGSILAIYVGSNIVTLPPAGLLIVGFIIAVVIWVLVAGESWWIPIFVGATVGGTFYVGFKVFPIEVAFALSIIGLIPLVLVRDKQAFQFHRKSLPLIFYVTGLYIAIRLLIDVVPAAGARGNLSRILFSQTWCFVFAFLFHHYGSLSAARKAIGWMFAVLLVRAVAALIGFVAGIPLIVPGLNYALSFKAENNLVPMRYVAFMLMISALIIFHSTRSIIYKTMLIPVCIFASVLVVMGQGRFATLVMLLLPLAFFAWSRRWLALLVVGTISLSSVAFINVVPDSLDALPPGAGRALSGLVFSTNVSQSDFATEASDAWHDALRAEGYRRWTSNLGEIFVGDGITPSFDFYDMLKFKADAYVAVTNAANVGGYECGLWSVMGLTGLIGFGLYVLLFIRLWWDVLPYFLRRPQGTFWEGLIFWGCYASISWYVVCYFQGYSPTFELLLMIIAKEVIDEGKLDEAPIEIETPSVVYPAVHVRYSPPSRAPQ